MEEDHKSKHTCKFCHKIFPCGRSLGGHMRSHLIPISSSHKKHNHHQEKPILVVDKLFGHTKGHGSAEEDSSNSSNDHHPHKPIVITDNMSSDNEAAALCRKKRSERTKRCTNSCAPNSDDLQEQEEVALSLILLSMDCVSSVVESHNTSSQSSEAKKAAKEEFKAPRKRVMKSSEDFEGEVNSPKTLINKNGSSVNPFGSDHKKRRNVSKNKCIDSSNSEVMNGCKFSCIICKKGFPSYQALGGHRASHKKFKGCCAPASENTDDFQEKGREHECLICFRVFPSGQALGGHKRSHLMSDQAKTTDPPVSSSSTQRRMPEIRGFLDLNLPAPAEEDCNEFKTWWIGTSHDPLLSLLSS